MRRNSFYLAICLVLGNFTNCHAMGLRSFVALPLDKEGVVMRMVFEHSQQANINRLTTNAAYGISEKQTLFLALPFRLSPTGDKRFGDVSVLYRHIVWQDDRLSGTSRLGLLGGIVVPTDKTNDVAIQSGFVFTHFNNRYEIDIDALYQTGVAQRPDSGRYDLSWQYRLFPSQYPEWGISQELYGVLELNGRWNESNNLTHQLTVGLQWVFQSWVLEGGVVKDLNNENEWRYILSTRLHF